MGKVPPAVSAQGPLVALEYAFHTWGWDCVVSGVIQTPDKMMALPFFTPTQRYSTHAPQPACRRSPAR